MIRRKIMRWIVFTLALAACQSAPQPLAPIDGAPQVFVPAGEFTMGSNVLPAEKPLHTQVRYQ